MNIRSLRLRLLVGAAVAILLSLAVAWSMMTVLFQRHLERREIQELDRQAVPLIAGLQVDAKGRLSVTAQPPDPRFTRPSSGLYWQISSQHGRLRSRSLWDQELPTAHAKGAGDEHSWHHRTVAGPFEPDLLLLERRLKIAGGHDVLIQLAEDQAPVRTASAPP